MLLRWLGELVSPSRCAACDAPFEGWGPPRLFCGACAATVELATSGGSAFVYGGAIATAIARMKYAGRTDLAPRLGAAMASMPAAVSLRGAIDLVVPVPMHRRRLIARGANHAALLAAPVARTLSATLAATALERLTDTPRQASLDRRARLLNVKAAFACRRPRGVRGARIVLVDDVRTTGATLAACSHALVLAGARTIDTLVLATRDEELSRTV